MAISASVEPRLAESGRWHRLLPVTAVASLGLMVGGLLLSGLTGGIFPSPYEPSGLIADYFAQEFQAVRLQRPFMIASAAALACYTSLISARMRALGQAAFSDVSLTAGALSAGMLALSGLLTWVLARGGERAPTADLRTLHDLTFVTGGVCHVVFLALMIAAISMASRSGKLLPAAMVTVGAVLAVLGPVALASLLVPGLSVVLPIVRFPGLVWMIVTGFLMTRPARAHAPQLRR
jgi:hypothetical protein